MKDDIRTTYTLKGVQDLIQDLMKIHTISMYEMAKLAGLNPATIYFILHRKPKPGLRPVRPKTLKTIARGLGYEVIFEASDIILRLRKAPLGLEMMFAYPDLMKAIDRVLRKYSRQKVTNAMQKKIVKMVELLMK